MVINLDIDKDFTKLQTVILELPQDKKDKLFIELKKDRNRQYNELYERIGKRLKASGISEQDALEELKKVREEEDY